MIIEIDKKNKGGGFIFNLGKDIGTTLKKDKWLIATSYPDNIKFEFL